jgi:DNA-directed RNA polymerase specialized sigma24 family protein
MDDDRPPRTDQDEETVTLLKESHEYIQALPPEERHIATLAATGAPIWEIAQQMRISEGAVAHALDRIVAALTGRTIDPVETGGLGADTDPGVSGGYDPEPLGGATR